MKWNTNYIMLTVHCIFFRCSLFLNELLCVQAMNASFEKALETMESISCVFNINGSVASVGKPSDTTKTTAKDTEKIAAEESDACFGFEDLSITPKAKISHEDAEKKTPERAGKSEELTSDKKRSLEELSIPVCTCVMEGLTECSNNRLHKLSVLAGVAVVQFLLQAGNKTSVVKVLYQMQTKYDVFKTTAFLDPASYFKTPSKQRPKSLNDSGLKNSPGLLASCLTATCVQAEMFLHQKDYNSLDLTWSMVEEMQENRMFDNVLHETFLLSRLALCEASRHLLASTELLNTKLPIIPDLSQTDIQMASSTLQDVSISTKKKVSFGEAGKAAKVKAVRDIMKSETKSKTVATPLKSKKNLDIFMTPKLGVLNQVFSSAKKPNIVSISRTPANRIKDLATLLDEDDRDIVFPSKKPVTPSIGRSGKSRTESRKSRKTPMKTLTGPQLACKLDFISGAGNSVSNKIFVDDDVRTTKEAVEDKVKSNKSNRKNGVIVDEQVEATEDVVENNVKAKKGKVKNTKQKKAKVKGNEDINEDIENEVDESKSDISQQDNSVLIDSKLDELNKDVFNFSFEASPLIGKTKVNSKSAKKVNGARKATMKAKDKEIKENRVDSISEPKKNGKPAGTSRSKKKVDSSITNVENAVEEVCEEKPQSRGRRKKNVGDVEIVRTRGDDSIGDFDVNIEITELSIEASEVDIEINETNEDTGKTSSMMLLNTNVLDIKNDFYEPIEVMRGDTRTTRRTGRTTRKKCTSKDEADNSVEDEEGDKEYESKDVCRDKNGGKSADNEVNENEKLLKVKSKDNRKLGKGGRRKNEVTVVNHVAEEKETEEGDLDKESNGKEEMRSGRLSSMKEMTEKLGCMVDDDDMVACPANNQGKKIS